MNSDYKKYNADLNTIDTSILIEEFDLRLKCDEFETKMMKILTQKHELLKNCIKRGSMSLVEENKERDINNNNNNKNNNNDMTVCHRESVYAGRA